MVARLLGRQQARVHLLLHIGVVLRDLPKRAVPQQVDPRIANLTNQILVFREHQTRRGRAHALFVHFGEHALVDRAIGVAQRLCHPLAGLVVANMLERKQVARDDLHRHLARHFTGRVTTHTVGHDEDAAFIVGFGEEVVLVSGADHAHIRAGANG